MPEARLHHGDQEQSILSLVQLQEALRRLYQEQRLDISAYQALKRQLEQRLSSMATALPQLTPEVIISACNSMGILADWRALQRVLRSTRLAELADKRQQALAAGTAVLDISAVVPGAPPIALDFACGCGTRDGITAW